MVLTKRHNICFWVIIITSSTFGILFKIGLLYLVWSDRWIFKVFVMNHGIIGKKVIMIGKKVSIRVLMWEILIETHYKNE